MKNRPLLYCLCLFFIVGVPNFAQRETPSSLQKNDEFLADLRFDGSVQGLMLNVSKTQVLSVTAGILNQGHEKSSKGEMEVFLSTDSTIENGILLQSHAFPSLDPGKLDSLSLEIRIPEKALPGPRFLIFALDPKGLIEEADERNNLFHYEMVVLDSNLNRSLETKSVVLDFTGLGHGQTVGDFYGHHGIEFQGSEWKGRTEGVTDTPPWAAAPVAETSLAQSPFVSWINVPRGIVGGEINHSFSHNNLNGGRIFVQAFTGLEGTGDPAGNRGTTHNGGPIGVFWNVFFPQMVLQGRSYAVWQDSALAEPFYIDQLVMDIQIPPANAFVLDVDAPFGHFEVPEGETRSFGVRLQEQLVVGEWLEIEVVRTSHTSGGEVLDVIVNTHTFTSHNWNDFHQFEVRAGDNNFNHVNGKATFEIRKKGGVYGNDLPPVTVDVEELDNEFFLTVQPSEPIGGGPVGGTTNPDFFEAERSLNATGGWRIWITATPDPGYQVANWEVTFGGATATDGDNREGDLVLGPPEPAGNGAVRRLLESITLDPDGESFFAVRPVFTDVPPVSVTFVVGSGTGSTVPDGVEVLALDETIEIEATPASGFRFDRWRVLSGSATLVDDEQFRTDFTPHSDCVIEANFEPLGEWVISPEPLTVPEGEVRHVQVSLSQAQDENIAFSVVRVSGTQPEPVVNGSPNFVIPAGSTSPVSVPIFAPENDGEIAIGSAFFDVIPTSGPPNLGKGGFNVFTGEDDIRLDLSPLNTNHGSTHPSTPVILDTAGPNSDLPFTITATPVEGRIFFGWTIQNNVTSLDLSPPELDTNGTATSEIRATSGDIVMVAEFELDQLQFVATPNPVEVPEGGQKSVSITLSKPPQPQGQGRTIVAKVTPSAGDENLTVADQNQTFTFTDDNWNDPTAWVKTFQAAQDGDGDNGQRQFFVEQVDGTSVDLVADLSINAVEIDSGSVEGTIVATPTAVTIEAGQRDSFLIQLSEKPSGTVEVRPRRLDDFRQLILIFDEQQTSPPHVFNSQNWNIPQEVVVVVWELADTVLDPDEIYTVNVGFEQVGGDGGSYERTVKRVHAKRSDGEAKIWTEPRLLSLDVGVESSVAIKLTDAPSSPQLDLQVHYEGDGEIELEEPTLLRYTPDTYDHSQFLNITGLKPGSGRIRISWASGSPQVETEYVTVHVNGGPPRLIANPDSLDITAGNETSFTLELSDAPESTVTFALATQGGGDLTLLHPTPAQFSFSPENFPEVQTVRVRGGSEGSGSIQITQITGEPSIEGLNVPVRVTTTTPSFVLSPSSLQMGVGDQSEFSIKLATEPEGQVNASLSASGSGGVTILEPTGLLQFTPQNYQTPQVVRLTANQVGTANVSVTQTDGSPSIPAANLPIVVGEASGISVEVSPSPLEFPANQAGSLQVKLSENPGSVVVLALTTSNTSGNPNVQVSNPTNGLLTFTPGNGTQAQVVSVTASGSGTGQIALNHDSGPLVNGAVVPVIVDSAGCTGTLSVTVPSPSLNEGTPGTVQIFQSNLFGLNRTFEITSESPEASSFGLPQTVEIASGQTVSVPVTALEDDNVDDEQVRFTVSAVQPSSPPCTFASRNFDLLAVDDDFQLTLQTAGDNGSSTTAPPAGTAVSVDTTTFGSGVGFPILAQPGSGYRFSHWTGDVGYLMGGGDPTADPAPRVLVDGPDPAVTQVTLTAHFVLGDIDVNEEVDPILDPLLNDLLAYCGLGAEDFSEYNLESGNRTGAMDGGRILPHSGQEIRDEVDLSLPGLDHPTQLRLTRRHMTRRNADRSPFGPAWFFNYRIYFSRDDGGNVLVHNLGRADLFEADPLETGVWNGTGGRFGRMVRETSERVVLRAPSGVKWQFEALHEPANPLFKGILEKIISPNGNEIRFEYQAGSVSLLDRKMVKIVDAFGREVQLVYGPDGQSPYVTEVRDYTDPESVRVWQYAYDAEGRLTDVHSPKVTTTFGLNDFPEGKRTEYHYHGHADSRLKNALTGIVAPNQTHAGQAYRRYQWTFYDDNPDDALFGYVKSHTIGSPGAPFPLQSGGTFVYSYQPMSSGGGMDEVSMCTTVTDRAGVKTALDYNRRGLLLEERVENPDAGLNKAAASHFKQTFTYNLDGDLTSSKTPIQVEQGGTSDYREEHPDRATTPRHMMRQERRRVLAADLRGGDQTEIIVETQYEPIFNKVFSTVNPRGLGSTPEYGPRKLTTYQYYDYMEDLTAAIKFFAPQLGLTVSELTLQMNQAGIPDRIRNRWGIDPLAGGKVDINEDGRTALDPCGNLIRREFPDTSLPDEATELGLDLNQSAYERFVYNRFGQMIQRVDAERNVTNRFFFPAEDPSGWAGSSPSSAYGDGGGFLARTIEDDGPAHPDANSGAGAPPVQRMTDYAYRSDGGFPRNSRGIATLVTDGRGVVTRNLINELDQLVIRQAALRVPDGNPDLAVLRYQMRNFYDANDNVRETSVHNRDSLNGGPTFYFNRFVFDILDQPVRKIMDSKNDGLRITTEFEYDANQNLVKKTDGVGTLESSVTEWSYDARDLLVTHTRGVTGDPQIGEVATTTYEYDDNGNRVREIDADGDVTQFEYDGFNRLLWTQDRVGNLTKNRYNAASQVISVENHGPAIDDGPSVLLSKTVTRFDQRDRAFETREHLFHYPGQSHGALDPGANGIVINANYALVRTETIYDRLGRPIGVVDADGDLFRTQYNGMGGVFQMIDPLGNSVRNQYDVNHNLVEVTEREVDPDAVLEDEVFVTRYRYDALNRVYSAQEPNGQTSFTYYDSRNNVVRTMDPLNNVVDYHFDALNRKIEEIRYLSASGRDAGPDSFLETINLKTEWDALSRMIARIDDHGNRTEYRYDDLNRRVARLQPGGFTETWVYNGDGEMTSFTNQAGSVARWKYDEAGRPLQMSVNHGQLTSDFAFEGTLLKRWQYDGLNRQIYAYDDNGTRANPAINREVSCHYIFDSLSRPILELQTLGRAELGQPLDLGKRVIMEWQGRGRLVSQTYPDGRRIERNYDGLDRLSMVNEGAGGDLIAHFSYMGPDRDLRVAYGNGTVLEKKDPRAMTTLGFGYDDNRRSLNHTWFRLSDGLVVTGYEDTYNGNNGVGTNRVVAQHRTHLNRGDQWTLDARYRITNFLRNYNRHQESRRILDGTDAMTEFLDEGNHRNPLSDNRWLDYFYFGSLPREHDENGNLRNDIQLDFTYDFQNRLVGVRDFGSGEVLAEYAYTADNKRVFRSTAGATTRYLYQGWQVLEERDSADQVLRQYVEGRTLDEHLQMLDVAGTGLAYYYHSNAQGFVGALSDPSGQVVEYVEYSMLGRPTLLDGTTLNPFSEPVSSVGNPYFFQGRPYDPETKLFYFRNRYYDPATGHFITVDPMGRWHHGQGNGFSAFDADPWNLKDPMGLQVSQDEVQVYAFTRDLDGVPLGTHTYFVVTVPDNPTFERLRPNQNTHTWTLGDGIRGFTIGGHKQGDHLVVLYNQEADLAAAMEHFGRNRNIPGLGFDANTSHMQSPDGNNFELARELVRLSENYRRHSAENPITYTAVDLGRLFKRDKSPSGFNCNSLLQTMLEHLGQERGKIGIVGFQPGRSGQIPDRYFEDPDPNPAQP